MGGETAEIRRWADDLLSGVSMNQVLRDLAARKVLTSPRTSGHLVYQGKIVTRNAYFAATEDARRTWEELPLGRKREVLRHLITVTLPPPGRGRTFNRDLI